MSVLCVPSAQQSLTLKEEKEVRVPQKVRNFHLSKGFSAQPAHYNHLGSFKIYWRSDPTPNQLSQILWEGIGFQIFPGDTKT